MGGVPAACHAVVASLHVNGPIAICNGGVSRTERLHRGSGYCYAPRSINHPFCTQEDGDQSELRGILPGSDAQNMRDFQVPFCMRGMWLQAWFRKL